MTVESAIFDALKGLVGNRVFPDFAPGATATPYVVYQQVGGEAPTFLERIVPSKQNGRFQVSVWAPQRSAAVALSLQIEAAMVTATAFESKPLGAPIALFDEETQLRGSSQDFGVWSSR